MIGVRFLGNKFGLLVVYIVVVSVVVDVVVVVYIVFDVVVVVVDVVDVLCIEGSSNRNLLMAFSDKKNIPDNRD